jgi:predicted TIM-barrel fold metal-dependent hydrolase
MRYLSPQPSRGQRQDRVPRRLAHLDGSGPIAKDATRDPVRKKTSMPPIILSSDSHVFEPPDLWQTRIDAPFRDRAPRIQRIGGADQIVVEADQVLSGIGLISNAGARFEAPETISAQGRFEDVHRGGYDPGQHLKDMELDGVAGEVLYPSQGLFYFKVADPLLVSAIFRAYNDWLAEFCRTDPVRLKGIAMINLDDVADGIKELERTARLGLAGAMITEYPAEDRRFDQPEYETFWAAAEALGMPLSLHTATRRQGKIRGVGDETVRDASSRATKAFYPALSMCDLIFSGVFERHPRLTLAIVEFELAWAPHLLSSMDYTYRERQGEAIYRFKEAMLPSDFFHRNVVLGFQEDAIGIRLRDVIGVDNMMWGSDYPHSESTFPQSRKILAEILAGVQEDERAKIVGGNTALVYDFDLGRLIARSPLGEGAGPAPSRISDVR